jgi:hypothetical protein
MRLSYLPPLMVYIAFGIQGLTGIVGTFFVKDYLEVSAQFLAALGFWAGIPWALKMPVGHVVDLIWRWKAVLVWLGAAMLAASLLIMLGLITRLEEMRAVMAPEHWFVIAALLTPTGYMIQDAVADAMTVEAVPHLDERGEPLPAEARREMHTTMQTLGRVAVIGGLAAVGLANVYLFQGTEALPKAQKLELYADIYKAALVIPVISVLGVILHRFVRHERAAVEKTTPNWWVLGGSLAFAAITLAVGLGSVPYAQELIFSGSFAIILFLLWRLARELSPEAKETLIATALVIFIYRAMPGVGPGYSWWTIDILKFDESFLSKLSLVAYALTLVGMFALRKYMGRTRIPAIIVMLTLVGTLLTLPNIGMYYGMHEWTARVTGGVVDARFIALIDTALESPLGQIAMIPMLAWIANSAPANLKATYFAVMASFTNLALSAAQLGTKYMNQLFTVSREVKDRATGAVKVAQDYSQLGELLVAVTLIGLVVPLMVVLFVKAMKLKTA